MPPNTELLLPMLSEQEGRHAVLSKPIYTYNCIEMHPVDMHANIHTCTNITRL